jgi:hypothetical protein
MRQADTHTAENAHRPSNASMRTTSIFPTNAFDRT